MLYLKILHIFLQCMETFFAVHMFYEAAFGLLGKHLNHMRFCHDILFHCGVRG